MRGDELRGDALRGDALRGDALRGDALRGDVLRSDELRSDELRSDKVTGFELLGFATLYPTCKTAAPLKPFPARREISCLADERLCRRLEYLDEPAGGGGEIGVLPKADADLPGPCQFLH